MCRLELYFSNKSSPEASSNKVDLSINEENNTIVQLQSNSSSTSKEIETIDTTQNSVTSKNNYTKNCKSQKIKFEFTCEPRHGCVIVLSTGNAYTDPNKNNEC